MLRALGLSVEQVRGAAAPALGDGAPTLTAVILGKQERDPGCADAVSPSLAPVHDLLSSDDAVVDAPEPPQRLGEGFEHHPAQLVADAGVGEQVVHLFPLAPGHERCDLIDEQCGRHVRNPFRL